jgi:hypothetical protein
MIKNAVNESMFQSNKFIVCVRFAWIGVLVMQLFFFFFAIVKENWESETRKTHTAWRSNLCSLTLDMNSFLKKNSRHEFSFFLK